MSHVVPALRVLEAIRTICNADAELRTLCGRSTALTRPWGVLTNESPLPVILHQRISVVGWSDHVDAMDVQFAAFAVTPGDADKIIRRVVAILTTPAFAVLSLDVGRNPERLPLYTWPPLDSSVAWKATERADVTLSLLIPATLSA